VEGGDGIEGGAGSDEGTEFGVGGDDCSLSVGARTGGGIAGGSDGIGIGAGDAAAGAAIGTGTGQVSDNVLVDH
jgi:hypothetical protein